MKRKLSSDEKEGITICRVSFGAIVDLRHRMLRAGMPAEAARFPGDMETSTWHVALYYPWPPNENAPVVSCASFVAELFNGEPAWRLRGMCTETEFQSWGFGGKLLACVEAAIIKESSVRLFWCNARVPALRFYERHGWKVDSEVFDIPTAGPHRRMVKRCDGS